jgi:hypothetical protein
MNSPEGIDLSVAEVFLLEHQTGMGSCKRKFFVSAIRTK